MAAMGLQCFLWAFSSCGKQELLCCGAQASHCGDLSCGGAQALGFRGLIAVAHGLSCSSACGIFPMCHLGWQVDA